MVAGFSPDDWGSRFSHSLSLDQNGDRRIILSVKPGRKYIIARSDDLLGWEEAGEVFSGGTDGDMEFLDSDQLPHDRAFYKLKIEVRE